MISKEHLDLAKENDWLRRENRILKEEKEVLIKATLWHDAGNWLFIREVGFQGGGN